MSATNRLNTGISVPFNAECTDRAYSGGGEAIVRWTVRALVLGLTLILAGCTSVEELKGRTCNNPPNPDAGISACTYWIQSGRLTPENLAVVYSNRGLYYVRKGEFDRAIQDCDESIRLSPNVLAFNNRGMAYVEKGEFDRAIQDYDQAIRLNSNFTLAFANRGIAYLAKGDLDRAIQDYDESIRLNPNSARHFAYRGEAYAEKGDLDRAIQDFDQAIHLNPNGLDAFYLRGMTRFIQGPAAAAVPDFARSAELAPAISYPAVWLYVAKRRAGQNADTVFSTPQTDADSWSGAVRSLFLGKMDRRVFLESAKSPDTRKELDQLCEAHFYLAEQELVAGAQEAAVADFYEVANTCGSPPWLDRLLPLIAKAELKRLGR